MIWPIEKRRVPFRGYTASAIEQAARILLAGQVAHGPRMTCGPEHQAGAGCIGISIFIDPGGRRLWTGHDLFEAARLFVGCLAMLREGYQPEIVAASNVVQGDYVCLCGCRWPSEVFETESGWGPTPTTLLVNFDWPRKHRFGVDDYLVRRAQT